MGACYRNALALAVERGYESIGIPLLATNSNTITKPQALKIALQEIGDFLQHTDAEITVKLAVADIKEFCLPQDLFYMADPLIKDEDVIATHLAEFGLRAGHYRTNREKRRRELDTDRQRYFYEFGYPLLRTCGDPYDKDTRESNIVTNSEVISGADIIPDVSGLFKEASLRRDDFVPQKDEDFAFANHLMMLLNEKGMDNATVYKRSNVTRGAFSKILCGDTKHPQKKTVLGLCIGLKLNMEEARDLLASADMAFNPYTTRDRLVMRCISQKFYDVDKINAMLFSCNQALLGT